MQSDTRLHFSNSHRGIVFLALLILIVPQWLLTRDMFDGATVAFARVIGNTDGLFFWMNNSNWWLAIFYYKFLFLLSDLSGWGYLFFVKMALSAMIVALYVECALLARDLIRLPASQAAYAGLLCAASPCLYTLVNSAATPIFLCIWLVFLGHRLFWSVRLWVRLVGLATLVVSFQLNSNLVFALALNVVHIWRFENGRKQRIFWFATLFCAAVAVYLTMRRLSPPQQLFVEYNNLLNPLNPDALIRMLRATAMFLSWGIIPILALIAISLLGVSYRFFHLKKDLLNADIAWPWSSILCILFLASAAAFPYVMVGKGPPLFTLTQFGSGLTEQVLRSAHDTFLAPTWANTSTRHGFLFAIPIALLTWVLVGAILTRLHVCLKPAVIFTVLFPLALIWVLPAYLNKLQNQWGEISLVKGFKELPPAPAGIVELRYRPITDWLIWSNNANLILREAWGTSHFFGMFYSIDAYKDDLYWGYSAYLKGNNFLNSRLVQNSAVMDKFPGEDCITKYVGSWKAPTVWEALSASWNIENIPSAKIVQTESGCETGRVLPNPTPWKKIIP